MKTAGASDKNQPAGRVPIEAAGTLRKMLRSYYEDLYEAGENPKRKVAWLSSVGPSELVRSFGFEVYYPENHGAMLGAGRTAAQYIPYAVSRGFSPDICSYLTSDIGAHVAGESPLTAAYGIPGVPKPDVLVYSTNQCRDVCDWWSFYGREFNVPVLGVHPPHLLQSVESEHLAVVEAEHRRLASELASIAGQREDRERLREIVRQSQSAAALWREVLDLARHRPSPFTFFDGVIHMAPIVLMRGTPAAINYYQILKQELTDRIEDGVAAVPGERLRLYWEGMPVWGALRELSSVLFAGKAAVVASSYCNTWAFDKLDPDDVERSMALVYTELFINRTDDAKLRVLRELIEDFAIDGVVFHDCKTCPNNTNCRYGMPERLYEGFGIPTVVVGGDMADMRLFSSDQARTTLEGFVEQLSEN